jgi:hypothetical protein
MCGVITPSDTLQVFPRAQDLQAGFSARCETALSPLTSEIDTVSISHLLALLDMCDLRPFFGSFAHA